MTRSMMVHPIKVAIGFALFVKDPFKMMLTKNETNGPPIKARWMGRKRKIQWVLSKTPKSVAKNAVVINRAGEIIVYIISLILAPSLKIRGYFIRKIKL